MNVSQFVSPRDRPEWTEELSEQTCNICGLVTVPWADPVLCDNEHVFCRACIESHLHSSSRCPVDKESLTVAALRPSKRVARITQRLEVRCRNAAAPRTAGNRFRHGCRWHGTVSQVRKHETKECQFRIVKCPRCTESYPARGEGSHQLWCAALRSECPLCQTNMERSQLQSHMRMCPKAKVSCPNRCLIDASEISSATPDLFSQVRYVTREDLPAHLETCPFASVKCPFAVAGCKTELKRHQLDAHLEECTQDHLQLVMGLTLEMRPETGIKGAEHGDVSHVPLPVQRTISKPKHRHGPAKSAAQVALSVKSGALVEACDADMVQGGTGEERFRSEQDTRESSDKQRNDLCSMVVLTRDSRPGSDEMEPELQERSTFVPGKFAGRLTLIQQEWIERESALKDSVQELRKEVAALKASLLQSKCVCKQESHGLGR